MTFGPDGSRRLAIGWFISPHGFGHAARAAAVMNTLARQRPDICFEIFTTVPEFFFAESLVPGSFHYHPVVTDIGLVQYSALNIDIPGTIQQLGRFLPFQEEMISANAELVRKQQCRLLVCDIAPMGIVVAEAAGIPSLLMENFTWDWIYRDLIGYHDSLPRHCEYLQDVFSRADYHIRTEPAYPRGNPHLVTAPISRSPRTPGDKMRGLLNIPNHMPMVLISMGGIGESLPFRDRLLQYRQVFFVIPGSSRALREENVLYLGHQSAYFHPDLIGAADVVIGKPGYSTVAEVYHAGIPFAYISRKDFRESRILEDFIQREISGMVLNNEAYYQGGWLDRLPGLIAMPRSRRVGTNGAMQAAEFIAALPCCRLST